MHISITGDLGSGKSTVAKELCKVLNYNYLSTGLIHRQLGQEKGMNTLEFNKFADENKEIDDYIDQKLIDINDQSEPYVLDSRLAWHFVKKSFKVYLMAAPEVAAVRVLKDKERIGEPSGPDVADKINELQERRSIESYRFEKIYDIKPDLFNDFDAIIDASSASVSDVTDLILNLFQNYKNGETYNKFWLSPHRIYPTKNIRLIDREPDFSYDAQHPIHCVLYNGDFFVFTGHKGLSACLKTGISLIPVLLSTNDVSLPPAEKFVRDSYHIDWIHDWEEEHGFRFLHYPGIQ